MNTQSQHLGSMSFSEKKRNRITLMKFASTLLLAVGIAMGILGPQVASGQQGEWTESLDGPWQFTIDPAKATEPTSAGWDTISVPGNWDTLPAYLTHKGKGWYRRSFRVSSEWKGKRVRLKFDAVYHDAVVTLNGVELGTHSGGYTPFEFDITERLVPGKENTLTVCADNTAGRGAWWHWGGISRSVSLVANNDVRIVWQHIRAEPDLKAGNATVFVEYLLANTGKTPLSAKIQPRIAGTAQSSASVSVEMAPLTQTKVSTQIPLPKTMVRLWHFDRPNLLTLESTLSVGGSVKHSQSDRFGIRKIEVKPDGLYLNGERIRVPGFNRVSDSNETGNTEPDALVRKDVDMMKQAGAVFARLMHYPQAPNLLDYLDEKGMLIFGEIPVWGDKDPNVKIDNPLTRQWLAEMINRDFNHPCIIGWSPGNEITHHYDYVRSMLETIRKDLDPHRLAAYVSFTAARGNASPENDPVGFGDIAMINVYAKEADKFTNVSETLRSRWPEKPVFFSEYGVKQIGEALDSTIPNGEAIWAGISAEPYVIGGALWTFNDYRSDFKGTPASGNREWGVVTVRREPKAAYEQVRKLYCPVRSFSVAGGSIQIEPRSPSEIPSYTLRGYRVKYTLRSPDGKILKSGTLDVPELAPGAPVCTVRIPDAREGVAIEARLFTPTGYAVSEARTTVLKK